MIRYIIGTLELGITFKQTDTVEGYYDADFAGDLDTRRSSTSFVFMLREEELFVGAAGYNQPLRFQQLEQSTWHQHRL